MGVRLPFAPTDGCLESGANGRSSPNYRQIKFALIPSPVRGGQPSSTLVAYVKVRSSDEGSGRGPRRSCVYGEGRMCTGRTLSALPSAREVRALADTQDLGGFHLFAPGLS